MRYKVARVFRYGAVAQNHKKDWESRGFKARIVREQLRAGSYQFVLYRSKEKIN